MKSERKAETESCFSCNVEFPCPKGLEIFEDLLEDFKARLNTAKINDDTYSSVEEDIINSGFGENTNRDQLIVMDDASGLTNESKNLQSFLTVARKFTYTCFYIFHTIHPEKPI